jgi:hypothetical protein
MSTVTITPALDLALRQAIAQCRLRLTPLARSSEIITRLETFGVTASLNLGMLELSQNGAPVNTVTVITSLAQKAPEFFITATGDPKTWTREQKVEFLRTHSDLEYQMLYTGKQQRADVALDPQMTVEEWRTLDWQSKNLMIKTYDPKVIAAIQARHKR